MLIVAGYLDQGGKGMIQASLDTGAFDRFILPDGMVGQALTDHFGDALDGSIGTNPGTDSPGAGMLAKLSADRGFKGDDPYVPECYDASALLLLAMQAAGSTDSKVYKDFVTKVANAPGEKIYPGELAKALKILADGGDIDYVGGTAVELVGPGEADTVRADRAVRRQWLEARDYRVVEIAAPLVTEDIDRALKPLVVALG